MFLFTQQNEHTLMSMQTTETQLGGGIGEMEGVFQRVGEECFRGHGSWSEKSSMNISHGQNVFVEI